MTLERRLSAERLAPYRTAEHGDLANALKLYQWNAEISGALGTSIGHVEVLLRNAMHDQLTTWTALWSDSRPWYFNPTSSARPGGFLFPEAIGDIAKARDRAVRDGRPETPGRVVAELSLGFWRFLLARRYDRGLWHPCLHRVFPGRRRATVFDAVGALHDARNRMAHHETMFNRPLGELFDTSLQVAGWICPVTRSWIEEQSRVPEVLASRP